MRKFIISTETNTDLSTEYLQAHGVLVIPHYYTVDEVLYGEEQELSTADFYKEMRAEKKVATMASNPAVILEKFTEVAKSGQDILHISFSSALSGGYSNIVMMGQEVQESFEGMMIEVVDTLSGSMGEGIIVKKAVELCESGMSLAETKAELEAMIPHLRVECIVDDLNHLQRGGRVSKTTAIVGTLANIKPILQINAEGSLVALGKARGRKKSLHTLADHFFEQIGSYVDKQVVVGIIHGDCKEDALFVQNLLLAQYPDLPTQIRPIGPSIGAHSGPGTVGLCYLGE
ncbi:MAG: DegV family protein [Lachnospiraceae bacterium]